MATISSDWYSATLVEVPYVYTPSGASTVLAMFTPEGTATTGVVAQRTVSQAALTVKIQLYWSSVTQIGLGSANSLIIGTHDVMTAAATSVNFGNDTYTALIGAFVRKIDVAAGTQFIGMRLIATSSSWVSNGASVYQKYFPHSLTNLGCKK